MNIFRFCGDMCHLLSFVLLLLRLRRSKTATGRTATTSIVNRLLVNTASGVSLHCLHTPCRHLVADTGASGGRFHHTLH